MIYRRRPEKIYPAIGNLCGILLLLLGRCLRWSSLLPYFGAYSIFCKTVSGSVITLGFAILLLLSLNSQAKSSQLLSKPLFQFAGKLSYGIYIWHILFISCLHFIIGNRVNSGQVIYYYILVCLCSGALSYLTYYTIERYYFKQKLR